MALTPATTDPKYKEEKERRAKDPDSFGVGEMKTAELAKKIEADSKKGPGQK